MAMLFCMLATPALAGAAVHLGTHPGGVWRRPPPLRESKAQTPAASEPAAAQPLGRQPAERPRPGARVHFPDLRIWREFWHPLRRDHMALAPSGGDRS